MYIAIDFDGTIVEHDYPRIGKPVPGAIERLKRFQQAGAGLILWTMRCDGRPDGSNPLKEAVEYCRAAGVEFLACNCNPTQGKWTQSPKAYAHVYIDDAAVGCPLIELDGRRPYADWSVIGPRVMEIIEG